MGKCIDIRGQQFGRLTVISYADCINGAAYWNCLCSCGRATVSSGKSLRRGHTKSCGCYQADLIRERNTKHGWNTNTATIRPYTIWKGMVQRCTNPNHKNHHNYGGRDITICDRWKDFSNFLADMGEPEPGLTLDRIDNDKGYSPENCRWATRVEQARNCRTNVLIEFEGKTQTLVDWAEEKGIKPGTLWKRLKNLNWTIEQALTTPTNEKRH